MNKAAYCRKVRTALGNEISNRDLYRSLAQMETSAALRRVYRRFARQSAADARSLRIIRDLRCD